MDSILEVSLSILNWAIVDKMQTGAWGYAGVLKKEDMEIPGF